MSHKFKQVRVSGKKGLNSLGAMNTPLGDLRNNCIKKDSWNIFVGDPQYKTNFFLQFKNQFIETIYERYILKSALYSIRLIIIMMGFVIIQFYDSFGLVTEGKKVQTLVSVATISASLFGTSKKASRFTNLCKQLLMFMVSFNLSWLIISDYTDKNQEYMIFFFFAPIFLLGLLILSSWL
mmetsp:Transcript_39560/g.38068  ORF Transcript_39560/g.38068 Transcript_39560/m.38068 type:complete len:180 (+) Transcript_39560:30-569(+)